MTRELELTLRRRRAVRVQGVGKEEDRSGRVGRDEVKGDAKEHCSTGETIRP